MSMNRLKTLAFALALVLLLTLVPAGAMGANVGDDALGVPLAAPRTMSELILRGVSMAVGEPADIAIAPLSTGPVTVAFEAAHASPVHQWVRVPAGGTFAQIFANTNGTVFHPLTRQGGENLAIPTHNTGLALDGWFTLPGGQGTRITSATPMSAVDSYRMIFAHFTEAPAMTRVVLEAGPGGAWATLPDGWSILTGAPGNITQIYKYGIPGTPMPDWPAIPAAGEILG